MHNQNFTRGLRIFSGLLVAFTFLLASCSQGETYEPKVSLVKTQATDDTILKVDADSLESLRPPVDYHP